MEHRLIFPLRYAADLVHLFEFGSSPCGIFGRLVVHVRIVNLIFLWIHSHSTAPENTKSSATCTRIQNCPPKQLERTVQREAEAAQPADHHRQPLEEVIGRRREALSAHAIRRTSVT